MSPADETVDVVVVGAGIAGVSAAAEIAADASVAIVEMEATPAHHATGRSAALVIPTYGPGDVRRLTAVSLPLFEARLDGDADHDLVSTRLVVYAADSSGRNALDQLVGSPTSAGTLHRLDAGDVRERCPAVRADWVVAGAEDRGAHDVDVAAVVAAYRRRLAARGGRMHLGARVVAIARTGATWEVGTTDGTVRARVLVNAAGAWADEVANMAGLDPIGLDPRRRTIGVATPTGPDPLGTAFLADAQERFYLGAEPGGVLFSPADETPSPPCDARPEEIDVARALDAIDAATTLGLRSVRTTWAGLRTFSPDGSLVIGADPVEPAFVWCAGQGGYGIQTAPAAALATAAAALGRPLPPELVEASLRADELSPARFRP